MSLLFLPSPYCRSFRLTGIWDEVRIYYAAFEFTTSQRAPRSSNLISTKGEITWADARSQLYSAGGLLWKLHTQWGSTSTLKPMFSFMGFLVGNRRVSGEGVYTEYRPYRQAHSNFPSPTMSIHHLASSASPLLSANTVLQVHTCLSIHSPDH